MLSIEKLTAFRNLVTKQLVIKKALEDIQKTYLKAYPDLNEYLL